jgi:hypothetical protein
MVCLFALRRRDNDGGERSCLRAFAQVRIAMLEKKRRSGNSETVQPTGRSTKVFAGRCDARRKAVTFLWLARAAAAIMAPKGERNVANQGGHCSGHAFPAELFHSRMSDDE